MAFGNPYSDPWSIDEVVEAVRLLESEGITTISLADTVGLATPEQVRELVGAVLAEFDYLEIGVHLHSRPDQAIQKILAAYDAGCRRFDSAIGGLGGCPFAQDALVGNISTENVLSALAERNVQPPIARSLETLIKLSSGIAAKYSAADWISRHGWPFGLHSGRGMASIGVVAPSKSGILPAVGMTRSSNGQSEGASARPVSALRVTL
jgi:hydroxymethylglutaryl-CoA lyase